MKRDLRLKPQAEYPGRSCRLTFTDGLAGRQRGAAGDAGMDELEIAGLVLLWYVT